MLCQPIKNRCMTRPCVYWDCYHIRQSVLSSKHWCCRSCQSDRSRPVSCTYLKMSIYAHDLNLWAVISYLSAYYALGIGFALVECGSWRQITLSLYWLRCQKGVKINTPILAVWISLGSSHLMMYDLGPIHNMYASSNSYHWHKVGIWCARQYLKPPGWVSPRKMTTTPYLL